MENLQGKIRRMITFIMLFVTVLCGRVWGQTPVNGHVTLKIEHKNMSEAEAQTYITQKKPVYLTVSLIFKGGWVDYFDNKTWVGIDASSFSYAIVTSSGTTYSTAPFDKSPKAWMISDLACTASGDGRSLSIDDISGYYPSYYIPAPLWNKGGCPNYAYGTGFSNSASMTTSSYIHSGVDEHGDKYYEVDLFPIAFYLKSLSTIYVRGIDVAGSNVTDADNAEMQDGGACNGTTELNFWNRSGVRYSMAGESGDWTYGSSARYGGIIPGGIFIEQAPIVAQFEPCR